MASRLRTTARVLGLGFGIFTAHSVYTGNERFYRELLIPTLRFLVPDGEKAHRLAVKAFQYGFIPRIPRIDCPNLKRNVFGLHFDHPVGIAAGFDKHGEAVLGLLDCGFSHVEVGTVTPEPQSGNPRPRVFRWNACEGVVNRYGFNSVGHDEVYNRLKGRSWEGKGVVGVNLGCNKTSTDQIADFVAGVTKFGDLADYLVINVSSPNTPGLRSMQQKSKLRELLSRVLAARSKLQKRTPILLKISPDESDQSLADIVQIALETKTRVDGLIVSNTTLCSYEEALASGAATKGSAIGPNQNWGGLSGKPLREKSTACLAKVSQMTRGQLPLIGVGGISDAEDAQAKIEAGAVLVQLYTSMIYQGPPVISSITKGLETISRDAQRQQRSVA